MFEYKLTENFDIGTGYGEYRYDFFAIKNEDDFWKLMYHYDAIYRWFDYYLDGYEIVENNTDLSPAVKTKMNEHNANLCLTLVEEEFKENNVSIRQMIVNEQKPNGIYKTYFFYFYRFPKEKAKNYFERGLAYAKSGLHYAAIRYFSRAIKLAPSLIVAFVYRGISYLEKNDYDKAIENFTQAINLNSEDSNSFLLRGFTYKHSGDFNNAKTDFLKALELNPSDEMAKKYLEEINKAEEESWGYYE